MQGRLCGGSKFRANFSAILSISSNPTPSAPDWIRPQLFPDLGSVRPVSARQVIKILLRLIDSFLALCP
jgi:hypothetical protein